MANKFSLGDLLHYTNRRTYSDTKGEVAYLDSAPLRRPFSMPLGQRVLALIIVAIAIVLGFVFINNTVISAMRESAQAEQAIEANLARQASIETLPNMADLITRSDKGIKKAFKKAGYTVFDASSEDDSEDMTLYKLPADVTLDEAAAMYAKGISNLTAVQATKLLVGSWQFVAERSSGTSMVVRYADFTTGDPQIAVQNALEKSGFDPESISDSGVDDSGNTYSTGTLTVDDETYVWRISAIPLEEIYDINNMPEEACYIGVRVTK